MEKTIKLDSNSLHFLCYPSINLVAHTANLLHINMGGSGNKKYHLRDDPSALSSINYSGPTQQNWFYQSTEVLVHNHIETVPQALKVLRATLNVYHPNPFVDILTDSWNNFYENYWNNSKERIYETFEKKVSSTPWQKRINKMMSATGATVDLDFFIVSVEATADAATLIQPNIIIGTAGGMSSDFVHEGLHALIALSYDKYQKVYDFINSHTWTEDHWKRFPYMDWKGKIEQAVVITLDALITNREEYLDGCYVGDLRETVYTGIKAWYEQESKESLPDVLMRILKDNETAIFV